MLDKAENRLDLPAETARAEAAPARRGFLRPLVQIALMALVLALGLTGFLQTTDLFWGEEWLEELHAGLATTLIALAGIHAAAAIVIGRLERVNLVGAMITGIKRTRNGRVDVR